MRGTDSVSEVSFHLPTQEREELIQAQKLQKQLLEEGKAQSTGPISKVKGVLDGKESTQGFYVAPFPPHPGLAVCSCGEISGRLKEKQ